MIGVSLGATSLRRLVVLPGTVSPPGSGDVDDASQEAVKGYVLEEDGPITATLSATDAGVVIDVAEPSHLAGRYEVTDDDLAEGVPIWLIPPTTVEDPAGTWTVRDDGLYVAPADDPARKIVVWERNGHRIQDASGDRYVRDVTIDAEAEIACVSRLVNAATPIGGGAEARTIVQTQVRGDPRAFGLTGRTDLVHEATADLDARRLMVVFNGRFTEQGNVPIGGIHDPSGSVPRPVFLQQLSVNDLPFRMEALLRHPGGGESLLRQACRVDLPGMGVSTVIGEDLCFVGLIDAESGWAETWASVGGRRLARGARNEADSVPPGSRIKLSPHTWFVGRPDVPFAQATIGVRRFAVWSADVLPDLSQDGIGGAFYDGSGYPKGLDRLNALVGNVRPLIAISGDAARAQAGSHDGTWGPFASTGADEFEEFTG